MSELYGATPTTHHTLAAEGLTLAYDKVEVARDLSIAIPTGKITCIVGANACGKSTLLRALARLLKPVAGSVLLDGQRIQSLPTKEVATRLGILPQTPVAPEGITVVDLISRGRHPHQTWLRQWSERDESVVVEAMRVTGTLALAERPVDELSGGQRQRAWIAMALAQGTDVLLLDEPTTFLDVVYQLDVLELVRELHDRQGITVVMVLHDLSMAARYADRLVAMRDGAVVADGTPAEVVTPDILRTVFDLECEVIVDPRTGRPVVVPISRAVAEYSA